MNTRVGLGTFTSATGVLFQVRIGANSPTGGNSYVSINTPSAYSFISLFSYFSGLPAGSYTVTLWARTNAGTVSSISVDGGGWGGNITIKETF